MQAKSRKLIYVLLAVTLAIILAVTMLSALAAAATSTATSGGDITMVFTIDKNTYTANGAEIAMDTNPVIVESRTMLPIRFVAEPLGAAVDWDVDAQKVTIRLMDTKIELWIGQGNALVNGATVAIDPENPNVRPLLLNSRTMLPIRFVTENLGCCVGWKGETQEVTITKGTEDRDTGDEDADAAENPGVDELPGRDDVNNSEIGNNNTPSGGVYVSPTGNDAVATGSIDKPYKSVNAALAAAKPGDTIILRGGTYREGVNVRVRIPDITIKSAEGEWAVIDLTTYDSGADEDSGVYFDVDSSGGKLQGIEVKGGFYAVCLETKWDWGDPADRAGASNIIIEDCILHNSRYDVIKIKPNCDNVVIRNNEIYNSGQAFAGRPKNGEDNAEGVDNVNGDNMVVQNNHIHDICSNAIYAKGGASDALIENNRIERACGGGILVGFDTSPEFFDLTVNPRYYENIRGIVRDNLIVDTGWEGIGLYGSLDAQVYNNTLVNAANGGQYHSAIYFGLTYQDWEDYAARPANRNPNIHHNIVCQPSGIVRPMIEIRYADELGGLSALDGKPLMSDNCYYIETKARPFSTFGRAAYWKTRDSPRGNPISAATAVPLKPIRVWTRTICRLTRIAPGWGMLDNVRLFL